jgi:uncharacterized protein
LTSQITIFTHQVHLLYLISHSHNINEEHHLNFTEAKLGRIYILRLHHNECLHDVIEDFAIKQGVTSALCFFLGGVKENSKIIVGPKDDETLPPEPMTILLKGVHEACGVGTIFTNDQDKPKLHMHSSFGRNDKSIIGCVRMGVDVWHIGEVIILELSSASAKRAKNKDTGFEVLEIG